MARVNILTYIVVAVVPFMFVCALFPALKYPYVFQTPTVLKLFFTVDTLKYNFGGPLKSKFGGLIFNVNVSFFGLDSRPQKSGRRDFTGPSGEVAASASLGLRMEARTKFGFGCHFCFFCVQRYVRDM